MNEINKANGYLKSDNRRLLTVLNDTTKKELVSKIEAIDKRAYFIHHIFGSLNKEQTIRFLNIHTNHHLNIVEDILK